MNTKGTCYGVCIIQIVCTLVTLNCERFEPRSHFKSRLSLIVRVNVVLNRTVTDVSTTRAEVIFRVKVSCIT